jgi:hypothetical protein
MNEFVTAVIVFAVGLVTVLCTLGVVLHGHFRSVRRD